MSGPSASSEPQWAGIHDERESWRKKLIGEISDAFVIPRYVRLFYDTFGPARGLTFCEIGSGNGDMSRAILAANEGQIQRYVTSEYFDEGVEWLHKQGLESVRADAEALPWADEEFDAAVEFDVMHHVKHPRAMARELMRVSRGNILLVESNGLSLPRKLLEMSPGHRAAGERSYAPWTYRQFFTGHRGYDLVSFQIAPFLFPFKCPTWFLPLLVRFNELVEHLPFFNWQCSSVWIRVRYHRTDLTSKSTKGRS